MTNISLFEQAGISIPDNLPNNSVSTVFEATGLNWDVIQKPLFTANGTNPNTNIGIDCYESVPSIVANYRSDTDEFLGVVHPKNYKVVQNEEAFNFIDELANFTFERVGEFSGGRKVFVIGKSNEQIDIDGSGDMVDFYLTFLHGHDGKSGIRFILCPVRMFCMNQLNLMLEQAKFKYNITHTGDIETKLIQIQGAISSSRHYVSELDSTIKEMISTPISRSIEDFVFDLIPKDDEDTNRIILNKEEARNSIIDLYKNKDDLQNYKGSSFGVLSAVSDYTSHIQPKRISTHTVDNMFINSIEGNKLIETARLILMS